MNKIQELKDVIDKIDLNPLCDFVNTFKNNCIYTCGCGGGFNLSQHLSEDCGSYLINKKLPPITAVALGSNGGFLTAISNDICFNAVFTEELKTYYPGDNDILVCFSGSGNSECLLSVTEYANKIGMTTVSFTGFNGGKLANLAKIHINVPSNSWAVIHSMQSYLFHLALDKYIEKIK